MISPARDLCISIRISSGFHPSPKSNINFVSAASTVVSCPLMAPTCNRCMPVSYRSISTAPVEHWVTLTIITPLSMASFTASTNHCTCGAFPEPKLLKTTPFSINHAHHTPARIARSISCFS